MHIYHVIYVYLCVHTESVICTQLDVCYVNIFRVCTVNCPGDHDHFKNGSSFETSFTTSALRKTCFIAELYVLS